MKKILYPFIHGIENIRSFRYTVELARRMKAEVILFCPLGYDHEEHESEEYRDQVTKLKNYIFAEIIRLKGLCLKENERASDLHKSTGFHYIFYPGDLKDGLTEIVKKRKVHLVVLNHELTVWEAFKEKFNDFFEQIIEHTNCPVLLIPENSDSKLFENILIVTDFNRLKVEALRMLKRLANVYNSKVTFIQLLKNGRSAEHYHMPLNSISNLTDFDQKFSVRYLNEEQYLKFLNGYEKKETDILTYFHAKKNFFHKLIRKNETDFFINSKAPLLVLNENILQVRYKPVQ